MSVLHPNAKIALIRRAPLFSNCSRKELEAIAALADEIDLPKGKTLIREGERGREFFVLLEGEADVKKGRRTIRTMHPGDFFGEIALIANTPRTATVVAKTPLRTLVITDRAFRGLMDKMPELQGKVMQTIAERLNSTVL
jgi:CRP/FNR family transcriptional regulator, cyclic AMP receptor protein